MLIAAALAVAAVIGAMIWQPAPGQAQAGGLLSRPPVAHDRSRQHPARRRRLPCRRPRSASCPCWKASLSSRPRRSRQSRCPGCSPSEFPPRPRWGS